MFSNYGSGGKPGHALSRNYRPSKILKRIPEYCESFEDGPSDEGRSSGEGPSSSARASTSSGDATTGSREAASRISESQRLFNIRMVEAESLRSKFPDRVPVVVRRARTERYLPCLEREKFLAPEEIRMSLFVAAIRNRLQVDPNRSCYFMVNNQIIASLSMTMIETYAQYKNEDGFLYLTYASEDVFG